MTERDRCWNDYQRSHASARRVLLLAVIVVLGALLGYHPAASAYTPATYSATGMP